jgi:hypothetical protein
MPAVRPSIWLKLYFIPNDTTVYFILITVDVANYGHPTMAP